MLLSIALRLIHCHEMTSDEDIALAYHTLHTAYEQQSDNLTKDEKKIIQRVIKLIEELPCLTSKESPPLSSSATSNTLSSMSIELGSTENSSKTFIPHYHIGEYVWCQVGGWGYWPGKILERSNDTFVIAFLNNEHEFVPFSAAATTMKSLIHSFHTYTTVSTCRLDGFEAATAVALESLVKKKGVSQDVIKEITKKTSTERWSARMKRIGAAIQVSYPCMSV